ncbi:signal peptidase I [Candidatus Uhrbacteria bacterium]|nr:signal peptidase I [Candidatus Uhrbacteria bacterium]
MFSFFLPKAQPEAENPEPVTKAEGTLDFLWELMKVVIISLAIILPVRYFLVQPFYVNGASMEPTYFESDYLIVDELSYRFEEPERGTVIIFKCSSPACGASRGSHLIKRVVGLPGEHLELRRGLLFIQNAARPEGFYLDERPYLTRGIYEHDVVSVDLGSDEYFVMGDNRCVSFASEDFGPIKRSWIVGRAWIRGWPFTKAGFIESPTYTLLPPTTDEAPLRKQNCIDYYQ